MFNIKISLYQTPPYQRSSIFECFMDNTSMTITYTDRRDLLKIIGN